ncbi:S-layer homology domain-containing protein [Brevibacillus ginsengisoli]|uniref:S-layer homology domain-containing protein n=1 Tax=Brevibacillus ginsengisoli TaxID=363854 RepID=UPI003CF04BC9
MRKTIAILLMLSIFAVTGCSQQAPILTDAFKQAQDWDSYESQSTLKVDTNIPDAKIDGQTKAYLQTLRDGIIFNAQKKNLTEAHVGFSLTNPSDLEGTGLWPSKVAPALDVFVKGADVYAKTSLDSKYLGVSSGMDLSNLTEENLALQKRLVSDYLDGFNFDFSQINTLPEQEIELPDGSKVNATPVQMKLDLQQAVDLLEYAVNQMKPEQVNEILSGSNMPEGVSPVSLEQLKAQWPSLLEELKKINAKELQAQGWNADFNLEFWITADHQLVKAAYQVHVEAPGSIMPEWALNKLEANISLESLYWNQKKPVQFTVPTGDQVVMLDQLTEDQALLDKSFSPDSPLYMLVSSMQTPKVEDFIDVPANYWAYKEINALHQLNVVQGYENNQFKPQKQVTRAEFVKMTVNALGLEGDEAQNTKLTFKDKNQVQDWALSSMETAVNAGLITGYKDNTLRPNQTISRAEMTAILVRALKLPMEDQALTFTDAKNLQPWVVPYVKTATAHKLIKGRLDGRFAPTEVAHRDEVAAVLYRIINSDEPLQQK